MINTSSCGLEAFTKPSDAAFTLAFECRLRHAGDQLAVFFDHAEVQRHFARVDSKCGDIVLSRRLPGGEEQRNKNSAHLKEDAPVGWDPAAAAA